MPCVHGMAYPRPLTGQGVHPRELGAPPGVRLSNWPLPRALPCSAAPRPGAWELCNEFRCARDPVSTTKKAFPCHRAEWVTDASAVVLPSPTATLALHAPPPAPHTGTLQYCTVHCSTSYSIVQHSTRQCSLKTSGSTVVSTFFSPQVVWFPLWFHASLVRAPPLAGPGGELRGPCGNATVHLYTALASRPNPAPSAPPPSARKRWHPLPARTYFSTWRFRWWPLLAAAMPSLRMTQVHP